MNPRWQRYLRFFGRDVEADVDDELRFHLEMRARDYAARGLAPDAAERAAQERFGDYRTIDAQLRAHDRAHHSRERTRAMLDDLVQDLQYAMRTLRRAPGFALIAIVTLALGIGANTAVFSVVDAVVLRALPYPDAERLTSISGSSLGEYSRLRELNRSWSDIAGYRPSSINLSGDGRPERLDGAVTTPNLFKILGVPAAHGRAFAGDETDAGKFNTVVLSDGLWRRRFGADASIVGKPVMIEGAPYVVLGVMPEGFGFPTRETQLWIPVRMPPPRSGALWGIGGLSIIGRLRDGVTAAQAQQELRALYGRIRFENPVWDPGPTYGTQATVRELQQKLVGSTRTMLFLLLSVVAVVLLIACANVANLLLVRASARSQEVAVRMALGGGRGRIIRQLMTESMVLAACGGLGGVMLAWLGVRELTAALPPEIPRITAIAIDGRVLGFTALLVIATGIGFGILPAIRASGTVGGTLRGGSRASTSSHRRLASLLVAAEIAAAVLLVIGATLLVRSATSMQSIDPGFRVSSLVTARITPPRMLFNDSVATVRFYDQVLDRLRALPGVQAVGAANQLPFGRSPIGGLATRIEGQFEDIRTGTLPTADHYQVVTPGYMATMQVPIVAGREFTRDDRAGAPDVAIVNESFARKFWPNGDALGKRIGYPWESPWITIVGIVKDTRVDSLTESANLAVFRPFAQASTINMSIAARTSGDPRALSASIRGAIASVDPSVPVSDVETMQSIVIRSAARQRFVTLLLALFAGLALVLGMVGIYGVMSYAVAQRRREIGIRLALGATPSHARRLVLRNALAMTAAGAIVGLICAALASRLLTGLLYGVSATDPLTFAAVPLAFAGVALAASYVPARRATRVDPVGALRE